MQIADEAMARARVITAQEARYRLDQGSGALLVDVRDEAEVRSTGLGIGAINASLGSLAWKADLEIPEQWREPKLQDRSQQIITTCGSAPCYRGATAANLLTDMGFTNVSYVDGGMGALIAAGHPTR